MKRRLQLGLLLGMSLAAFLLFLDEPDIVVSHEARVALPAREMAESGWPWAAGPAPVQPVVLFIHSGVLRLAPDWSADPVMVNPWLVPVLTGQVRLQKPPLPYWCAAVVFRLSGGFSEMTVRLVPALLGALAVLLVYDLGRVLYGRKIGWLAALAWISTYSIAEEYRKAMADPYLAFFTLGCVWAWVRASRAKDLHDSRGRKPRIPRPESGASALGYHGGLEPASFLFAFYLSFAFALLAKGPPAFIDILLPLAAFHLCCRAGFPGRLWMHAAGVLLMLAIALPWPIYVWRHVPHAIELWRYESVGEMSDNTENARPWHFYLPQLFFLALPWTAVGVVGIARQGVRAFHRYNAWVRRRVLEDERRRVQGLQVSNSKSAMGPPLAASQQTSASNVADPLQLLSTADKSTSQIPRATDAAKPQAAPSPAARPRLDYRSFFPLFWYFAMVVFFSFVHLKKNQYLLPVLPAQALLIAQGLAVLLTALRKPAIKRPALALIILQTLLAIGFAVAIAVMAHKPGHWSGADFAAAIIALAAAVFPVSALYAKRFRIWALVQAGVYIMLFLAFGRLCFAPREAERSAKPVAAEVAQLLRQPGWTLLTTQLPEEVAVYLPAGVHYDFRSGHVLVVLDDQHEVARRQIQPGEIPTPNLGRWIPDGKITEIKRVPLQAAPGDSRWKVWELTVDRKLFAWAGQESSGQE